MITLNPLHTSKFRCSLYTKNTFNARTYTVKTGSVGASDIDLSLYLVTNSLYAPKPGELYYKCKRFVEGGGTTIQLRFEQNECREHEDLAFDLQKNMSQWGNGKAKLIINDDSGLASLVGDGLHVGPTDMSPERAQKLMGARPIGFTAINLDAILYANKSDCISYIGIQVYPSESTHPDSKNIWWLKGLKEAVAISKKRIVVIGGIKKENVKEIAKILRPGDGIAITGDILINEDPYETTRYFRKIIDEESQTGNKE